MSELVRGIDVSQWQGEVDWAEVAGAGVAGESPIEFVFIRATVGLWEDPWYVRHWEGAGQAGLARGSFHYLHPGQGGYQANHFLEIARHGELPLVVDVEHKGTEAIPQRLVAADVQGFLDVVGGRTGPGLVYTRASVWDWYGFDELVDVNGWGLWVAHWQTTHEDGSVTPQTPRLPGNWEDWVVWQYKGEAPAGTVPGVRGKIDLNWARGG